MKEKGIEELIREEQRAYKREWRAKNKDKVRQSNLKYWEKRAKQRLSEKVAKA